MLSIKFFGVRGSTPCGGPSTQGIGGNTSCVVVRSADTDPIVLDLGTGLRYFGLELQGQGIPAFKGTALVSHLHWDHIQGIPFFAPLLHPDADMHLIGPVQDEGESLQDVVKGAFSPPLFPVELDLLPGTVRFTEMEKELLTVGACTIQVAPLPHNGPTNAYRIDNGTGSVAYLSDHQQPMDGSHDVPPHVADLVAGVDVLIHDAQYDLEEFNQRLDWGHSTPAYALEVARAAGAKRLVLFHHDPMHSDDWVRDAVSELQLTAGDEVEIIAAQEGMELVSG